MVHVLHQFLINFSFILTPLGHHFGTILEQFWANLEPSRSILGDLGRILGHLEAYSDCLGLMLGYLGRIWSPSCVILEPFKDPEGGLFGDHFWGILQLFWNLRPSSFFLPSFFIPSSFLLPSSPFLAPPFSTVLHFAPHAAFQLQNRNEQWDVKARRYARSD